MVSPGTSDSSQLPEASTPTIAVHTDSTSTAGYPHKDLTAADPSMELDYFAATDCDLLHPTAFMVKSHSVLENFELDSHIFDCIKKQSYDSINIKHLDS